MIYSEHVELPVWEALPAVLWEGAEYAGDFASDLLAPNRYNVVEILNTGPAFLYHLGEPNFAMFVRTDYMPGYAWLFDATAYGHR